MFCPKDKLIQEYLLKIGKENYFFLFKELCHFYSKYNKGKTIEEFVDLFIQKVDKHYNNYQKFRKNIKAEDNHKFIFVVNKIDMNYLIFDDFIKVFETFSYFELIDFFENEEKICEHKIDRNLYQLELYYNKKQYNNLLFELKSLDEEFKKLALPFEVSEDLKLKKKLLKNYKEQCFAEIKEKNKEINSLSKEIINTNKLLLKIEG